MTERNRLAEETSPYLLQHKDNPVHWQPWSAETLAMAREEGKPVLLSVGYAACHWCHVMAHESFENAEIAELMNGLFVNIKVDREERPDIDAIYQHALALMGEQGGWPLTMFLAPDGSPFWGGTYFPPEPRWGRPGFGDVLRQIAHTYHNEPDKVRSNMAALSEALAGLSAPQSGGDVPVALIDQVAERLVREVDPFNGGIGDAPKFPQANVFALIWRGWRRTRKEPMKDAVLRTLTAICQGGIYDHLGGGFARYSVDARWLAPHFEKMLYDNAQLIELLTLVWQETKNPLFAQRVSETIEWVEREMLTSGGGFASSLDADSEHEEGKFYVWDEAEIDRLLGPRCALFKQHYDVSKEGNWEGKVILNRLKSPALLDDETEGQLAACRAVLFRCREERVPPGLDDKVLADWNGLMIAALAFAGSVFERPDWVDYAAEAFAFVTSDMMDPSTHRLSHSWRDGKARHPATLDDYANLCRAALALHEATGEPKYVEQAERWIEVLDKHYADGEADGYYMAADDTEGLVTRPKTAHDSAVPAGNGTLVGVYARLYYLTGNEVYRGEAERIVRAFSGELTRNFFPLATLLNGNEDLLTGMQIVIRGDAADEATKALLRVVNGVSLPTRMVVVTPPGVTVPEHHPAHLKEQIGGKPTAYVCQGPVCSLPLSDPAALAEMLG